MTSISRASAERLEYDGKADKMQMFTNAEIQQGDRRGQGRLHLLRRQHGVLSGRRRRLGANAGKSQGPGARYDPAAQEAAATDKPVPVAPARLRASETIRFAAQQARRMRRSRSSYAPGPADNQVWP